MKTSLYPSSPLAANPIDGEKMGLVPHENKARCLEGGERQNSRDQADALGPASLLHFRRKSTGFSLSAANYGWVFFGPVGR